MKNIEQFFQELRNNFPKIDQCDFWNEYDWSKDGGYEHSIIMSELAKEISTWNVQSAYKDLSELFQIVESGFVEYDKTTSSYLATDFLVSIMEIEDRFIRDEIKKLMRTKTQETYRLMLDSYREL